MTDYPDELEQRRILEDYKRRYNSSPVVQDSDLKLVSASMDKLKTILLVFGVIGLLFLGIYVYLIYSDKLTPVNNYSTLLNNNVTISQNVTPIVNLYVNVQVNQTSYNVTEILTELNNSGFLDTNGTN